ncbi:MAG TPA: GNAT family N-acetyltransferase, partial [Terracidiphilus sp.]
VSVTLDEMRRRIQETTQAYPWLVCEDDDVVVGYCYAHKWKERSAYRHSVEISIYLDRSTVGQGRGSALLDALLSELRGRKFHCAIGGTLVPNPASIALLEKFGFRPIAHFKEVGYKFNRWIDVGYWQLML